MQNTITTKTLGTTTQVVLKRYGDGTLEFQATTAGGAVKRKQPGECNPDFDVALFAALATVA